jgi:hypothetical protein
MAFSGTLVASGRGTGVVVAMGADTELGRINQMMAAVSALETPRLRQIKNFGYRITAVIADGLRPLARADRTLYHAWRLAESLRVASGQ